MRSQNPHEFLVTALLMQRIRGSVKANIGHLEGLSGLAGILKAVMILEKGVIPPNPLFEKWNPKINAKFYNLKV